MYAKQDQVRAAVRTMAVLFLGLATFVASPPSARGERLSVKTYTVAEGLLRDSTFKIKQDSRGFLWFCTAEGVSRFDGYGFTNLTTADGLPDRHVNDFLETRDGDIWIATDDGVAKLNPAGLAGSETDPLFTSFVPDNPLAKRIQVLFEDAGGTIWMGTSDGLYKISERRELIPVDLAGSTGNPEQIWISSIIQDRRGSIWIGTANGLRRITPDGEVESFTAENGLPDVSVSALHEDSNGRIWIGFRYVNAGGLALLVPDPVKNQNIVERHYQSRDGLPAQWILDLFETSDGKFWVGTTRGLCEFQTVGESICKTYTAKNDLCDTEIWSIAEDKDNNIWVGTRCGVKKWARYGFTTYTEADGTGYPLANSIFENSEGDLFVSFNDGTVRSVSRFDGEKFELVTPQFSRKYNYSGSGWNQTVWQDRTGHWWFPTGRGLLHFSRPKEFADLSVMTANKISFGNEDNEIFRFFEDSRGDFWIMTHGPSFELWHWDRASDTWRNLSSDAGISVARVASAFVEDKSGNLWIGTLSESDATALIRYRDGNFQVYGHAENEFLVGWIRDLFIDGKGRLWIANSQSGLLRLDDVNDDQLRLTRYTPAEGLSSIGILSITEDAFGRIYVGTGRGLDRLNPDTGQVENFTAADGLPNSHVDIAYRDKHNHLWFGTVNGLARFMPEPQRQRTPPGILITGLRVAGVHQAVSILGESVIPTLRLNSDQRQVTVDFLGLGASLGEKLKYEYRLGNSDWINTTERTVNFANLSPGEYHFEVRTVTADRIYSAAPATLAFEITAPVWQRWWFITGILASIGYLVYVFYRFRLGRLLEMERIRTRIATDLHDDIGSNLSKISLLSGIINMQAADETAQRKHMLSSIADISRESVSSMNDIVWAINPKRDSVLEMTRRMREFAEELLVEKGVSIAFNVPEDEQHLKLSMNMRRELFLIFKEAINNAAKHSDCTKIDIEFRVESSGCFLEIADNGRGFDVPSQDPDGNGLINMRTRAEKVGGRFHLSTAYGSGTRITIRAPAP